MVPFVFRCFFLRQKEAYAREILTVFTLQLLLLIHNQVAFFSSFNISSLQNFHTINLA